MAKYSVQVFTGPVWGILDFAMTLVITNFTVWVWPSTVCKFLPVQYGAYWTLQWHWSSQISLCEYGQLCKFLLVQCGAYWTLQWHWSSQISQCEYGQVCKFLPVQYGAYWTLQWHCSSQISPCEYGQVCKFLPVQYGAYWTLQWHWSSQISPCERAYSYLLSGFMWCAWVLSEWQGHRAACSKCRYNDPRSVRCSVNCDSDV